LFGEEDMQGFIILLAIICIGCGPLALIISIIALNKAGKITSTEHKPTWQQDRITQIPIPKLISDDIKQAEPAKVIPALQSFQPESKPETPKPALEAITIEKIQRSPRNTDDIKQQRLSLEQLIGTRWILIAGVIAVIFAAGFFLKYAYDNNLIGPLGRVIIVAASGLIAVVIGEITRRRGYDIVAKSVTAMGFALLYAAVFSARAYYRLLDPTPAYILSILITAAAMLYAVGLNEIVAAILSLVGGFLTPVIVSTGENQPTTLFVYVFILSCGAMLCAYYRKWRPVELLSFFGTFALYSGWFEKFYRPLMFPSATQMPEQLPVALVWLGVFFIVYLILPILYEFVRNIKAEKEDVFLITANAAVAFYYLWTILFRQYRPYLAFCCVGLCVIHLVIMILVTKRCRQDTDLRLALLTISISFLTIAIPLYFKMYAIAIAWSIEAVVLGAIGLRYRSILTQFGGAVAMLLGIGQLLYRLPMHSASFTFIFNHAFGSWCFVTLALLAGYVLYRTAGGLTKEQRDLLPDILYGSAILLLMASTIMEWYCNCYYNMQDETGLFHKGLAILCAVFPLLLLLRPLSPCGTLCKVLSAIVAEVGAIFLMIRFSEFYNSRFIIFANIEFAVVVVFVIALFIAVILLKKNCTDPQYNYEITLSLILVGTISLWVFMTEEIYLYWYYQNRLAQEISNWKFLAHMYISIMWAIYGAALMIIGFWRKNSMLRYISIGLFALLLIKVFLLDTSTVKSVYRIGAFLATGITLVAISYLYQFLRKRGFFESVLTQSNTEKHN
jgi:uncharacterized membrane protein